MGLKLPMWRGVRVDGHPVSAELMVMWYGWLHWYLCRVLLRCVVGLVT